MKLLVSILIAKQVAAGSFPCNPNSENWSGVNLATCAEAKLYKLCTPDGDYGEYWSTNYGTFADQAVGGFDFRNCPECGCTAEGKFVYANKAHNRFI